MSKKKRGNIFRRVRFWKRSKKKILLVKSLKNVFVLSFRHSWYNRYTGHQCTGSSGRTGRKYCNYWCFKCTDFTSFISSRAQHLSFIASYTVLQSTVHSAVAEHVTCSLFCPSEGSVCVKSSVCLFCSCVESMDAKNHVEKMNESVWCHSIFSDFMQMAVDNYNEENKAVLS